MTKRERARAKRVRRAGKAGASAYAKANGEGALVRATTATVPARKRPLEVRLVVDDKGRLSKQWQTQA